MGSPWPDDRPSYRIRPLAVGEMRGLYVVAMPVIDATRAGLISFAVSGIEDGGHEGVVYWAGREAQDYTVLLQAIIPSADHSHQRVMVSRAEIGRTQRVARKCGLGLLCQVHSHPGPDGRHSDGDDELVLLPFEGMLSIVAPRFGIGFHRLSDACVHQFQAGRWVLCSPESVAEKLIVVPSAQDLR